MIIQPTKNDECTISQNSRCIDKNYEDAKDAVDPAAQESLSIAEIKKVREYLDEVENTLETKRDDASKDADFVHRRNQSFLENINSNVQCQLEKPKVIE